ncbi:hypothetical protein NECAME_15387 [Necator americanus]|uniref:Rrn7/TAF1B C-terminal cyclin domain-containing protein n=1 Tax=Necator americanus TaxID=51031 RepID=W2SKT2_NECAM|nr:hypothetical protein NECAME_15387 [Necator americanus]ETN69332.1 hypothetical protein NECAME_15387 [Necator americanus]
MGDTLNEDLQLRSDDEQSENEEESTVAPSVSTTSKKPKLVTVIDTKIPKEILENATSLYLAMDVFVAILYVSVMTIGCRWITLSDIVRWIREDRMRITVFQSTALDFGNVQGSKKSKTGSWSKMDLPLYEFQRTALFIWQICRLPPTPVKVDFKQIVARLLYHVNLPEAMMDRVLAVMSAAPPCRRLDDESLRRQGRIEQGPFAHGFRTCGRKKFALSHVLDVFGRLRSYDNYKCTDIFFSTETKAFAFILMALKLSFGLDDKREIAFSKQAQARGNNVFNFTEWFYQLKMRMMFWEGYNPLDILQARFISVYIAFLIRFAEVVITVDRLNRCSMESNSLLEKILISPLRSQEKTLRSFLTRPLTVDEKEEIRMMVEENAVKVFKANYEKRDLMEGTSSGSAPHEDFPSNWLVHFPCAKGYQHTKNSGLRMLFASRKGATDAWLTAKPAMSEAEMILYAAFLMLELQIVEKKRFEEVKQIMVDGKIYPIESTAVHRSGNRSYKTLYISAAENVTEAHEIEVFRIGLPKHWASGIHISNSSGESDEDMDYISDSASSSEYDSESTESAYDQDTQGAHESSKSGLGIPEEAETSTRDTLETPTTSGSSGTVAPQRDPPDHQCNARAYDFDTIWMLTAMRYW